MIHVSEPAFLGKELAYLGQAIGRRQLSGGPFVARFEKLVAGMASANFAVATCNGTSALHAALLALGLKPGDKVVVPSCSYIATANAVKYCGAEPVFVDVNRKTWTVDPADVRTAVVASGAVGAITVHLYGAPCELPKIKDLGAWVVEDACEAHGLPLHGDVAVFSFYGNKIVSCGEGGAVVTNDQHLAERVRLIRGQGTSERTRYVHETLGYNYRMGELQAAVGCAQIECLREHLVRRGRIRNLYEEHLKNVPRQFRSPIGVDWVMPVLVEERDRVAAALQNRGVETRPVFPPLHRQPVYLRQPGYPTTDPDDYPSLLVSDYLGEHGLLLPLHLQLTDRDVVDISKKLMEVL